MSVRWIAVTVLTAVVMVGCSDDDSTSSADTAAVETSATTAATTTVAPTTTVAATTSAASTPTATDDASSSCASEGSVEPSASATFTISQSQAVTRVETATKACYEDIVVKFTGNLTDPLDFPGWSAEYVDQPIAPAAGEPFSLDAASVLVVRVGASMPPADDGSASPFDLDPEGTTHVLHLQGFDDVDGQSALAIGLDAQYPYSVTIPDGPPRIVVRFFTG